MKELLEKYGWIFYKTGCSCNGSPRYYKNDSHSGVDIVLRKTTFSIRTRGRMLSSGKSEELESEMKKLNLTDNDFTKN